MSNDKFSKLTWHKRTHGHEFTGAEFRVLMAIFDYSDENGRKSHPGLKRLMADTGYGKTAVSEALTALQERGWITQTRKGSGTSGKTSVYELVPDAPSSTAGADQPTEVGPVERTSWSAGADSVIPLERTPTDPGSDPGSDPLRSDQEEVRYSPNHQEDQDETGLESRSLAFEGRTEATGSDDPFAGPPPEWVAESRAREERAAAIQPATAGGPPASPWN